MAIHAQPSRERLKRVLLWVVCSARPLSVSELADAVAIDEMDDIWDPDKVVFDKEGIVDDCGHLLIIRNEHLNVNSNDEATIQFIHASVRDYLSSNPALFYTPLLQGTRFPASDPSHFHSSLSQYHVYPLQQGHARVARDCLKYLMLCRGESERYFNNFMLYYASLSDDGTCQLPYPAYSLIYAAMFSGVHMDASKSENQILTSLFRPLVTGRPLHLPFQGASPGFQGTSRNIVFPNATHVKAIGCIFNDVTNNQYNMFSTDTDINSFGISFVDMFPRAMHVELINGAITVVESQLIEYSTIIFNELPSPDLFDATHVTVVGYTFNSVSGTRYDISRKSKIMISNKFSDTDCGNVRDCENVEYVTDGVTYGEIPGYQHIHHPPMEYSFHHGIRDINFNLSPRFSHCCGEYHSYQFTSSQLELEWWREQTRGRLSSDYQGSRLYNWGVR